MYSPLLQRNEDYLKNKIFLGIVEENKDSKRKGRIKIRVQNVFDDIEIEHIPWASPFRGLDGKNFSVPAIGKIVNVIFPQGNIYEPHYIYCENYNINLQNKLKDLSDDEYSNFVALLFDHRSQISVDDSALNLDYFDNVIRIKKDSIDVKLKDNTQQLNLGHSNCSQDAVLGTNFFRWFDDFMQTLLIPTTLTGNIGAPILRPQLDQKILEYQAKRSTFVSDNVKIVDNVSIQKDEYDKKRNNTPVQDDSTKINKNQILKQIDGKPNLPLQQKVEEQRLKNVTEMVENEPDEKSIPVPEKEITDDFHDTNIITEEKAELKKIEQEEKIKSLYSGNKVTNTTTVTTTGSTNQSSNQVEQLNSSDPYDGFWSGVKGNEAQTTVSSTSNQPGYGSYYVSPSTGSETAAVGQTSAGQSNVSNVENGSQVALPANAGMVEKLCKIGGDFAQKYKGDGFSTNCRVTYEHLLSGYKSDWHKQCPQGTKAMLYALIGDPNVRFPAGHADWFSFKDPATGAKSGQHSSFTANGYYLDKKRLNKQTLESYKSDKNKWQVGDIVVYGYRGGDKYGHIQIWTGYGWWSDFKQKSIGANKIDYTTVALWRMNDKALEKVKKRLDEIKKA